MGRRLTRKSERSNVMKKKIFSALMLFVTSMMLSGCIFPYWHDHGHGRGNGYGHDGGHRGGGGGSGRR